MKKFLADHGLFTLILVITVVLRLINLGYSDYQGDEIKALFLPEDDEESVEFLLDQRKGPMQFLVTYLDSFINPGYENEFLSRLPFAVASILAVLLFFKFIEIHFGKKIAFYSSFFIATNGFFVAFGRIVQYQSLILFFAFLALYMFSLMVKDDKWKVKGLYIGATAWVLSILSHYNGVFIFPFMLYLLYKWYMSENLTTKVKTAHLVLVGCLGFLLLSIFYVPFVLSLSQETLAYWQNRLSGGAGKVSSSYYLFTVYQPIYVVHIYTALIILGLLSYLNLKLTDLKVFTNIAKFKQKILDVVNQREFTLIIIWIVVPVIFFEAIVNVPGTHIFNYIVPLSVLLAYGIVFGENVAKKVFGSLTGRILTFTGLFVVFVFIFLQSYFIYVDNTFEYPWEDEKFFAWTFAKPTPVFHLSLFGFPYFRHWREIGDYIKTDSQNSFYSTNERKSIVRYYMPLEKDSDKAGYYILIIFPQSFTDHPTSDKVTYWIEKNPPAKSFYSNGKEVAKVYLMPEGSLAELKLKGY